MSEQIKQKFQIHYYFDDDSHGMNAFVKNKAEKDMLNAIKHIGSLLDCELSIETEAYQCGGLIEYLTFGGVVIHYLAPSLNNIITHYFIKDANESKLKELDVKIKQEILKGLELDNEKKQDIELVQKLEDKQTIRFVSNFYTKINNYEKVQKIGFKDVENDSKEYVVERKYFKNFILEDNKETIEDENATIEIISPILKEGSFKWRGIYNGEKIDFSMGDAGFKQEVIKGNHTFSNGSFIECKLHITIIYDDFGDIKRRNFSVREVYGVQSLPHGEIQLRESGKKKKRQQWRDEHQGRFDFEGSNDEK